MSINFPDLAVAESLTIQQQPRVDGGGLFRVGETVRGPLLPAKGSREREWKLRQYAHHDYNTLYRSAKAGLIKKVQSTPWEILSKHGQRWQELVMNADFGDWDRWLAKTVGQFLDFQTGSFTELIAPGDPLLEPSGPCVGIAALDTLRCYPTGNTMFPVIYYDVYGKMHLLHRSRVVQLVDSPSAEENLRGYGESALERAIAPVYREILIGRYVEQYLDDKPPPGIATLGNIGEPAFNAALAKMQRELNTDNGSEWGRVMMLYGLENEHKPIVDFTTFTKAPEGFDYDKYKANNAREIAAALGVDINEFWELVSSGLGHGTQSEVMAQKSRGKGFGRLLKGIERLINRVLPDEAEFRWQYKDPQEDIEEANKAQAWANFVTISANVLTPDEQRLILANQVPQLKDVLIDAAGNLKRFPDDDPKAPNEPTTSELALEAAPAILDTTPDQAVMLETLVATQRSFSTTASEFERRLVQFVRVGQAQGFSQPIMRATFRGELYDAGRKAYDEGLKDGGATPDDSTGIDRDSRVAIWLAVQNNYIDSFVNDVSTGSISKEQAATRAVLWTNKSLRTIYYAGLNAAAAEIPFRWQLGATEQHCKTCLTLNGVVRKMKDWLALGIMPGSNRLECQGYNCDCSLNKTEQQPGGRLPILPSVGVLGIRDPLGTFLQRIGARKSIELPVLSDPDVFDTFIIAIGKGMIG